MGSHTSLSQVSLLLAVLCTLTTSLAAARSEEISRCGLGRYWRSDLQRCADCTVCSGPGREVTLRPCSAVRDTQCGAVSDLHIDWSWLHAQHAPQPQPQPSKKKNVPAVPAGLHERINAVSEAEALLRDELRHLPPQQQRQRDRVIDFGDDYVLPDHPRQPHGNPRKQRKPKGRQPKPLGFYDDFADFGASGEGEGVGDPVSDDEDLARESWRRVHSRHRTPPTASAPTTSTTTTTTARPTTRVSLVEDFIVVKEEGDAHGDARPDVVVATTPSFTTAETLVWDWQAGVLVAAVCACLLFFFVAAAYSCQHAWHFKKLKKHLDADMEEISARLALMSGMSAEHFHDTGAAAGGVAPEKGIRRGDHLLRHQNEYCVTSMPRKTRV